MLSACPEPKLALVSMDLFLLGDPALGPAPESYALSTSTRTVVTVAPDPDLSLHPSSVASWLLNLGKLF